MIDRVSAHFSFAQCFVQSEDVLRVIAQADRLNNADQPNTTLMKWVRSEKKRYDFHLSWYASSLAVVGSEAADLYAAGPDGRVLAADPKGQRVEHVDPGSGGPSVHGAIRDCRWIGKHLYACGMGRQVYRREGADRWVHIDQKILAPVSTTDVKGFNAIDGASESDIVCVGFEGEIFTFNGKTWRQDESPTNVILNRVKVLGDTVYAVGQLGVILQRKKGGWQQIVQEVTREQIWDIELLGGQLYFSTADALYRIGKQGRIDELRPGGNEELTFGFLHANAGWLMSSGTKHVFCTRNGKTWTELT